MRFKRIFLLSVFCSFFSLFACTSPTYYQTEGNVAEVASKIHSEKAKQNESVKKQPIVLIKSSDYVDTTPVSLLKQPSWLNKKIIIRGDQLPFSFYSRSIVQKYGVLTKYQTGLDQVQKVSLNYSGSVKGALDLLSAKTDYVYTIEGKHIFWKAIITKTFDIAFMPGASDYLVGGKSGGSGNSTGSSGGSAGVGAVSVTSTNAAIDDSSKDQYSNISGKLSIWKDLEKSVKEMLSPKGTVIVSESTTSITVRDYPTNIKVVTEYIDNFNKQLSKQVLIKIQILEINLSKGFTYGINWDAVRKSLVSSSFVINGNFANPIGLISQTGGSIPILGLQRQAGKDGVTALINALDQQGNVSIVTQPNIVTLNNQVGTIRITDQKGYLASSSTTVTQNSSQTAIQPGEVITGLTLYVLPKIMKDKIYLQITADLATLVQIQDVFSGGTDSSNNKIQVPETTQKQFNQRSVIASGDTMILAGFKKISNAVNGMQFFKSQSLGGQGATQENSETIVLITPVILNDGKS